jgi:UDPglucose 6-dehydrogenase
MKKEKISIIGLGFVGLTLAAVNAKKGFETIGIDTNLKKIEKNNKGESDFYEPELEKILKKAIKDKKIKFTNNLKEILKTDITFLTVGTPPTKKGEIDLSYVKQAISSIIKILKTKKTKHTVVIKSTVVPTTTTKIIYPQFNKIKNIKVIVNPEFLRESLAIQDLLKPHLIVIGEKKSGDGLELKKYYENFYKKCPEILFTDLVTAEMIKYSNNAFLATKISFINSIANICQNIPNTDVKTITYAIGKDPRIGPLFLNAGPGFGGSCLPKDLSALIDFSKKIHNESLILKSVKAINDDQPKKIIKLIKKMGALKKRNTISVLGLAFKKNTDDIRESKSISLVKILLKNGIKIKVHDPMALNNFKQVFNNKIEYCDTISKAISQSHCCVIMTGWDEYKNLKVKIFETNMKKVNIIDAQRVLNPKKFKNISFEAIGLGNN